jgi:replicative DNA helicase
MNDFPAHPMPAGTGTGLLGLSQRLPPQSLPAEQALLGALLANNRAYDRVAETLRAEHFADPCHAAVYAAIARRVEAGQVADVVTLRPEFENTGVLAPVGGPGYLATLLGAMVGIVNASEYARLIRDAWARRGIIDAAENAANQAFAGAEAGTIIEGLDASLSAVAQGQDEAALQPQDRVADSVVAGFISAIERRGALAGVTTGLRGLDRKLLGMRKGQLIVLGARPSMGKTALGACIAMRSAAAGTRTMFVSAEMGAPDVLGRAVAAVAKMPLPALTSGGSLEPGSNRFRPFDRGGPEEASVVDAARRLSPLPLRWDALPQATVAGIRARARRLARLPAERGGGLDLIVVDYLGRCRGSPDARRAGRLAEVSEMVRDFKSLAVELGVPVLLLSQLSRAATAREDPRPVLSDLRDSGEIEQEADVVAFLHREHYYLERARPTKRPKESEEDFDLRTRAWADRVLATRTLAEVDIAKQRQGPIGTVRLHFEPSLTWFWDEGEADAPAVPFSTTQAA